MPDNPVSTRPPRRHRPPTVAQQIAAVYLFMGHVFFSPWQASVLLRHVTGRRWSVSGKRPWRSIRARRQQYGCPPSCYPAILASNYRTLPWRWVVTLTAPRGEPLFDLWREWLATRWDQANDYGRPATELPVLRYGTYGFAGRSMKYVTEARRQELDRARAQIKRLQPDAWPFWVAVFAQHPRRSGVRVRAESICESNIPHIHMVVGSISRDRMREALAEWPWRTFLQAVRTPWRILHYLFSQELTSDHARDVFSHCNNLMAPPFYSENFEHVWIANLHRERMRREIRKRRLRP